MKRTLNSLFQPSRRQIVNTGFVGGALSLLGLGRLTEATPAAAGKPFRVAHLTDPHTQPERRGGEGLTAALQSLEKLDPKPDLILTGGDHIMDAYGRPFKTADRQWDLYTKVVKDNINNIPIHSCIGNHDIWGWGNIKLIKPDTKGYGKALAIERLGLSDNRTYHSFDQGGWHFICLDNVSGRGNPEERLNYYADLDPAQHEWLVADLAQNAGKKPVCVLSHIPLLSACVLVNIRNPFDADENVYRIPDTWMQRDVLPLLQLLAKNNVKLCLSGHIHLLERIDYMGMSFICDGAVCGNWWKGPLRECKEGYGVLDLYPDGRFEHQYVNYGWKA